jgi:hypothetical protein
MKITEQDRIAARAERERQKSGMTEEAKRKLRELNEADRRDEAEEARLHAQFMKLRRDVPNLANALFQITGAQPQIVRMAQKLLAALDAGLIPTLRHASSDIVFLATLTPDEEQMSDEQFAEELKRHANVKHKTEAPAPAKKRARRSLEYKQAQLARRSAMPTAENAPVAC